MCDDDTHEGDKLIFPMDTLEVVEVFVNDYISTDPLVALRASVNGVRESQSVENFAWYGRCVPPTEGD